MADNNDRKGLTFLKDWGGGLTNWTERYIPDALVIVFILSIITFIFALIWGFKPEVGLMDRAMGSVQAWGKGFWVLLKFGMQMCLIMMTGYILACSPPVRRLLLVARIHGVRGAEFQKRIERLYRFSGLGPFRDRRAAQLSGGMKQKLGLSCVLIHQPKILLLDEPTVGVDPVSRREFWDILHSFAAQGTTILISTPYLEEAERCHRIAFLHEGRILEALDPRELRTVFSYATYDIYAPEIRGLLGSIQERLTPPVAFLSGDHIHLICDMKTIASGKLERTVKKFRPKGALIKETAPTVQDLYFILEKRGHEG